jgi:hypothetical protein
VTNGMRAMRFLCVSGEWFRVNWHLQGVDSFLLLSLHHGWPSWQPLAVTFSKPRGTSAANRAAIAVIMSGHPPAGAPGADAVEEPARVIGRAGPATQRKLAWTVHDP